MIVAIFGFEIEFTFPCVAKKFKNPLTLNTALLNTDWLPTILLALIEVETGFSALPREKFKLLQSIPVLWAFDNSTEYILTSLIICLWSLSFNLEIYFEILSNCLLVAVTVTNPEFLSIIGFLA